MKGAVVQLLRERKANANQAKTDDGWPPLIRASADGQVAIAQMLLEHKADINQADKDGRTALLVASKWGKIDVVRLLLEKGCAEATDAALRAKAIAEAQKENHAAAAQTGVSFAIVLFAQMFPPPSSFIYEKGDSLLPIKLDQ